MLPDAPPGKSDLKGANLPLLIAALLLALGFSLTTATVLKLQTHIEEESTARLQLESDRLVVSLLDQFNRPLVGIKAIAGLPRTAAGPDPAEFAAWVTAQGPDTPYQGVRYFGYAQRTDAKGDRYTLRQVASSQGALRPAELSPRDQALIRDALIAATQTGQASLSESFSATFSGEERGAAMRPDVLIWAPTYALGVKPLNAAERQAALSGAIFAAVDLAQLLLPSISLAAGQLDFAIADGTESGAPLLFASAWTDPAYDARFLQALSARKHFLERTIQVDGKPLLVRVAGSHQFEETIDHDNPLVVGTFGASLSVLLAIVFWLLTQARANALAQTGRALREKQALLNAVDGHTIVSIADLQGTIFYANALFVQISGYKPEELIGNNYKVLNSGLQAADFWRDVWTTVSTGKTWHGTICNRAKDGALYWVDSVISPFFDETGKIAQYVSISTDISATQRTKEQLQSERKDLQAILQGTDAGTWKWEVPTGRVQLNARWAEMLGYTLTELGDLNIDTWRELCHPEDLGDSNTQLERHFAGQTSYFERELRMRHRDGHWIWVQSRGKVSEWVSPGNPLWMSGIHLDVTKQKRLQSELAQSNQVLQSILDNIPVGLCVFDRDLSLITKNRKFQDLLDFPDSLFERPDTTYESLIRFNAERGEYGNDDVERSVHTIVAKARVAEHHQFERVRSNGVVLEVRGAPMPGGGFITLYADITNRRQADAEISRAKNMLQSVLDSASEVAVVTVDLNYNITLFNKGAERLLGYEAAQVIGQCNPAVFFDPDELEARSSAMSAVLGRKLTGLQCLVDERVLGKRNEWTHIHRDGYRFTVALVVTPLTDASGVRTGYLSVSHDITQEKEHEARLQIAMEVAEQASNAKGQFLANMSHEIRTPMNAILGMLQLLHHTNLDARQLDYTTKTESAARSLLGLLNDILDFSKSEAGKMELDPQPFSLDAVLCDLSVILSANVGSKRIQVLFDVDPALPDALIGDSLRLQQILINLAGNAIKFTESGEVVLSIQNLEQTASTSRMRIAVRDSGIGIDPKNQQHIFIGFSQAEASTTRRFGGTGLGLSICRRLIAMMGGELQLQSALGQGSTFYFDITLPRDKPADSGTGPGIRNTATSPGETAPHVLVIDANPTARQLIGAQCSALGWSVDLADSGASGLECMDFRARAARAPYSVVLMNWYLPGLGGVALARQILLADPHTKVIALVSAADREALSAQATTDTKALAGYLVKPLVLSTLQASLIGATERQPPIKASQPKPGRRLSGLRILVVEDNPINQQVAKELLRIEGAVIELADNGQLGVQAVAKAQPQYDLVLMDLQMPVMDGFTAAVTIRHELGLHALPIIAMTANAMASDREACLAAGMNDHIGKPFDLQVLIALIQHHTGYVPASDTVELSTTLPPPMPLVPSPPPAIETLSPGLVDIPGAMTLLGDNEALYAQIAGSFLEEISALPQRLMPMLTALDLSEAARTLHTIKGLSLTVGAKGLAAVCKRGELALKAAHAAGTAPDADVLLQLTGELKASVAATTQSLESALGRGAGSTADVAAPAKEAVTLDLARLLADLKVLESLLSQSDMRAIDAHKQLWRVHGGAVEDRFDALNAALHAFDFERGVVQCGVLLREFGAYNQK